MSRLSKLTDEAKARLAAGLALLAMLGLTIALAVSTHEQPVSLEPEPVLEVIVLEALEIVVPLKCAENMAAYAALKLCQEDRNCYRTQEGYERALTGQRYLVRHCHEWEASESVEAGISDLKASTRN